MWVLTRNILKYENAGLPTANRVSSGKWKSSRNGFSLFIWGPGMYSIETFEQNNNGRKSHDIVPLTCPPYNTVLLYCKCTSSPHTHKISSNVCKYDKHRLAPL